MNEGVKVIAGEYRGKTGVVTGMFWMSGMCTLELEDGTNCAVKISQIEEN